MARMSITGSADGLGQMAAQLLVKSVSGYQVLHCQDKAISVPAQTGNCTLQRWLNLIV